MVIVVILAIVVVDFRFFIEGPIFHAEFGFGTGDGRFLRTDRKEGKEKRVQSKIQSMCTCKHYFSHKQCPSIANSSVEKLLVTKTSIANLLIENLSLRIYLLRSHLSRIHLLRSHSREAIFREVMNSSIANTSIANSSITIISD